MLVLQPIHGVLASTNERQGLSKERIAASIREFACASGVRMSESIVNMNTLHRMHGLDSTSPSSHLCERVCLFGLLLESSGVVRQIADVGNSLNLQSDRI